MIVEHVFEILSPTKKKSVICILFATIMLSQTKFYNRGFGQLFKLHLGISHTKLATNLVIKSFKTLNLFKPVYRFINVL